MTNKELLVKIQETQKGIKNAWETIESLQGQMRQLSDELCKNISYDDLRPMQKEDIVVGQRFFGENSEGFYTLVIEEILGYGDLDFKAFVADGCRYGIYKHYIIKEN